MLYTREMRNELQNSVAQLENRCIRIYEKLSVSPCPSWVPPLSYVTQPIVADQHESIVARLDTLEDSNEDAIVPDTPPLVGESQGGTTVGLAIKTPEHLQIIPGLIPTLACES
jgi:hypothetical protein